VWEVKTKQGYPKRMSGAPPDRSRKLEGRTNCDRSQTQNASKMHIVHEGIAENKIAIINY